MTDILNGNIDNFEIHIRIKKRNGKKSWTHLEGVQSLETSDPTIQKQFLERVLKEMKKKFCCNGSIKVDDDKNTILELFGDQRIGAKKYLMETFELDDSTIKVHGF